MRVQKSVAVVGIGALVVIGTGSAVAATGHNLILGAKNTATKTTTLSDTKGTPLSLKAKKGKAPLQVNSSTEVKKLNAAEVGGLAASKLQRRISGKCATGKAATAVTTTALTCASVAAPITNVINLSASISATANGATLKATLAALTTASATNGYLITLGPGTWDLGTAGLTVPKHIDVVGSGADLTTITGAVDGGSGGGAPTGAVVDLSADSTLGNATVVNSNASAGEFQVGVFSTGTGGPASVSDVDITIASGVAGSGLAAGGGSTLLARDVKATVTAGGFAEGGRADNASALTITDSTFALSSTGIVYSVGTNEGSTVKVVNTQIPSGAGFTDSSAGATKTCFNDYTAALAAATC